MKQNFFKSFSIFYRALPHFILFELLFKLMITAFGIPVLTLLLKLTMKISGVNYISDEKAWIYLKNPVFLVVAVLVLFFTAIFTFTELSALTACFSCYEKGGKITVGGMFRSGFTALRKSFRKGGFFSFLKFMAFMPLVQFTLSSGAFMLPIMPILKTAFKSIGTAPAVIVYAVLQALLVLFTVNYSYSLHYLLLTDRPFRECTKKSRQIISGKKYEQTFSVIIWGLFMIAITALATFAVSFIILLFIKGFSNPDKAFLSALKVLRYAKSVFSAVSSFLIAPAIMCIITGKFFGDIPDSEDIKLPDIKRTEMKKLPKFILITSTIVVTVLLNYKYLDSLYKGNISLITGVFSQTQITAHRGFSYNAPENTMYAFEYAVASGADYIELDVQLTADEQVVVFHDEKLDRVTDGTGKLSDYDYSELQKLSAGCKFRKTDEFIDAEIPLLSDVFETIGDDILYNIEIKDKGNALLTTQKTVALVEEYGIENSCYITSFSYNVLKEVKKINPEIKTGLIANSSAVTSFSRLRNIDALSLNYIFVNSATVNTAHQNGKRVFVWTVDNANDIQKMTSLGVDNIITNRPDKATELVYSKSISSKILMILKSIFST
ncbi:MAG: glycerophosphoryl diester phosphodiesterase membrane domain-containing protein [Ruminococcus flavefaciens]|nr:glycerophosphoryl diester phosphodiesterase membrane domain-containing protein [Ruminococcus flavefaciens]MCM1228595.1 glycerophosphoryl diester phosphodiesterase membrane domain-containing protein [Ruminococcus flavefaciens]